MPAEDNDRQTDVANHLERTQDTLDFFREHGWDDEQVARIVGELFWRMHDPYLDPTSLFIKIKIRGAK